MITNEAPSKDEIQHIFQKLKPKSTACFDCGHASPTWASISNGCYLCISCSGQHRHLGVHLSFVRSTTLDSWSWDQLRRMKCACKPSNIKNQLQSTKGDLQVKYSSPLAAKWRKILDDAVEQDKIDFPDTFNLEVTSPIDRKKSEDFFNSFPDPGNKSSQDAPVWQDEETWDNPAPVQQHFQTAQPTITITGRKGKLGTKKVINLDEAEKRANNIQVIQTQQQSIKTQQQQAPIVVPLIIKNSPSVVAAQKPPQPLEMDELSERLGIGFKKMSVQPQQQQLKPSTSYNDSDEAQRRFKNSKSISSDQYHNTEPVAVFYTHIGPCSN
eukprot:NODE_434_length_8679_cov_0.241142.p3 type:complete len:326 gc:universal NODE_434_length_8679_cov_0.241142:5480-6457(+)